jgi:small subunit ribosomal protein S7e
LPGGRSALVVYIPTPKMKSFQRVHSLLVSELEKKYNQTVVLLGQVKRVVDMSDSEQWLVSFIFQRRILPKPTRKSKTHSKQKRPRK